MRSSAKPSRLRRNQWPEQCAANEKIAKLAAAHTRVEYVDIATAMLGGRPVPPRALFAWDGLHLSAEGYALWTRVLKPTLAEAEVRRRHGA